MPDALMNPWYMIPAVLVAIIGVARLTRVITYDDFPPAVWMRMLWERKTERFRYDWSKLFICGWCMSPWVMLAAIGWFIGGLFVPWLAFAWWIFWGWLALSYLAAQYLYFDEGKPDAS